MVLVPFIALLYLALGVLTGLVRLIIAPFHLLVSERSRKKQRRAAYAWIDSIASGLPADHPLRPENRGRRH